MPYVIYEPQLYYPQPYYYDQGYDRYLYEQQLAQRQQQLQRQREYEALLRLQQQREAERELLAAELARREYVARQQRAKELAQRAKELAHARHQQDTRRRRQEELYRRQQQEQFQRQVSLERALERMFGLSDESEDEERQPTTLQNTAAQRPQSIDQAEDPEVSVPEDANASDSDDDLYSSPSKPVSAPTAAPLQPLKAFVQPERVEPSEAELELILADIKSQVESAVETYERIAKHQQESSVSALSSRIKVLYKTQLELEKLYTRLDDLHVVNYEALKDQKHQLSARAVSVAEQVDSLIRALEFQRTNLETEAEASQSEAEASTPSQSEAETESGQSDVDMDAAASVPKVRKVTIEAVEDEDDSDF